MSNISVFGSAISPILPWNLQCRGDERVFNECNFTKGDSTKCQKIAGVVCEGEMFFRLYTLLVLCSALLVIWFKTRLS